jgi:hypothetical protein
MEGTDRLAVVDPARSHVAVGMRATAQQREIGAVVLEDRDPEAIDLGRESAPERHLIDPANRSEFRHVTPLLTSPKKLVKTKNFGLALRSSRPVEW